LRCSQTAPANPASEAELIQPGGQVILYPKGKHFRFPGSRGKFITIEQFEDSLDSVDSLDAVLGAASLPRQQKMMKVRKRDRFNFRTEAMDRQAMYSREEAAIAPFRFACVTMKPSTQDESLSLQREQSRLYFG
jgi:hypothetical protein